ncbi:LysE family translocator [Streptomyces sp. NPDC052396]|uniref:LysE family translocator n=1 Tax=Streptomyces sp. NPDC052396 TaxID=3365689 RepID=UPI0037CE0B5E
MITLGALGTFTLIVGLLTLTPGLDTALILRTAALGHRRRAWGVVLGIQSGTLIWGAFASLGVTALLTASHLAYEILRWAGAAYLLWMGARMLLHTRRDRSGEAVPDASTAGPMAPGAAAVAGNTLAGGWRQGTLTNLLNPKMGAFYVALLPQFIPPGAPHLTLALLLTSVHIVLGLLWSAVLIAFTHMLRGWLRKPPAKRLLDRVTGTVIVGFGLRLALGD